MAADPRATAIGFSAILMWSLLALLTVASGGVPPFQLAALCFTVGALVGLADMARRGVPWARAFVLPRTVWLLGVFGLFGFHFFYFTALRSAPPAQASLVAYLWPVLIVLFSGLLPGERLRPGHLVGVALGFAGVVVLLGPEAQALSAVHAAGYASAAACAVVWAAYSVLSRRVAAAPTESVAGFCLVSAALSALCHLLLETTVWPQGMKQWLAVAALGAGPVGGAFYAWDVGMKRGDLQLLGTAAYAAPLVSTGLLVVSGAARATPALGAAAALVTAGAVLAALAGRRRAAG